MPTGVLGIVAAMSSIRLSEPTPRVEPVAVSNAGGGGALIALSAVAAVAALVLGAVALIARTDSRGRRADRRPTRRSGRRSRSSRDRRRERLQVGGSDGTLILAVTRGGNAALVGNRMTPAAEGWAYQAWVYRPGGSSRSRPAASRVAGPRTS